ncbi:MAG: imidazoleglycerol-phosphate dehydratase HisB [Eubacteriales bacterium]|jgi:imidazoleglycerol-phosphate dehydratase|nr:imidazoleglycerol-phosphate dehydratase HisB [Eubacteriales bacterium]MDD3196889.1 imidazoleglycerol-phosphate dehydratase HisB [Eubacteriales bacterium]MDD3502794.1 imidazoleglycerol-phosphate dehydratase HisB [Eubacteriales bacterium]MDD4682496.1 imidazoleglycerol-phosphate dehydratase HisB [Eubacteriales bacterium]
MRKAELSRTTQETKIEASLQIDGSGKSDIATGIGFLDHMLTLLARHSGFDLTVKVEGDLYVDGHHSAEDTGIVLGQILARAVGDKRGIERYGHAVVPMDEALLEAVIDLSGRPFLVFDAEFNSPAIGDFDTQLTEEFFRALAYNAGMTLHLNCRYGKNDHHKVEGLFKAFARALRTAVRIDPDRADQIPSTKGVL